MKYIIIIGDGMADYCLEELGDKTPLQYADMPVTDSLACCSKLGMVRTVPDGMPPGSDVANLSIMGYDPRIYHSGRSSFEAVSMGIRLQDTDITFRCNLVTLSEEELYEERVMLDHSAGEISTPEAMKLIMAVNESLGNKDIRFYPGVSYRHLMIWKEGPEDWELTPPHDIIGRKIKFYMPEGKNKGVICHIMRNSVNILESHDININRQKKGFGAANSIWIWGEGKKPALPSFYEKYRLNGSVISAVDLIKGIGISAGLKSIDVDGATGDLHTNYKGKAKAAIEELKQGQNFVYVHIEAPDECSHQFKINNKVKAIELIDREVVGTIKEKMDQWGEDYRLMILPDHATPLYTRTHAADPVPFLIYSRGFSNYFIGQTYDEFSAQKTGLYIENGYELMDFFVNL